MNLIHNERTKLTATAVDRVSTAFVAVGVLGQAFVLPPANTLWISLLSGGAWLFWAIALHLLARRILKRLRE
jgi:hypothetical protein